MWWLLWAGLAAVGLCGLHGLALWAEARGRVYYRTRRMPPGAVGLAMMEVASIIHPAVEHVVAECAPSRHRQSRTRAEKARRRRAIDPRLPRRLLPTQTPSPA
jgi:hypothetical protein